MSSYSSGGYGGYDFQPADDEKRRKKSGETDVIFDDLGGSLGAYDGVRGIGSSRERQAPHEHRPAGRNPRSSASEAFDDYRPGTILEREAARKESAERKSRKPIEPEPQFDDDFDDDLSPRHRSRPSIYSYMPEKRGYARSSRYSDDYSDNDFESEFGGVKGLGVRKRQLSPEEQRELEYRARREREEEMRERDSYHGHATMRDQAYDGSVGVPKIFADYFREDYVPEKRVIVSGGSKSYARRSANKIAVTVAVAMLTLCAVVGGIWFLSTQRVMSPLNVKTALTDMGGDISTQLIKFSVDDTLSEKSVAVSYSGSNGASGTEVFRLSDYSFEYSTAEDGATEYLSVTTDSGATETHTFVTKGSIRFDETLIRKFLNDLVGSDGVPMVEPKHEVKLLLDRETFKYTGKLNVTAGTDGYGVDYDQFITTLMSRISTGDYSPIETTLAITYAPAIDVESIYKHVHTTASDAYSVTDGLGNKTYVDHVIGQDFDEASLRNKIAAGGTEWSVDLNLTMPAVTIQELRKDECPDLLATYFTLYNASNKARSSNLELAAKYINGTILQPGEEFSFNTVVGERTQERGFCKATVYSSEGTDEDFGGGICQVSSTLFYTTVLANLKTVKRTNHLYTVAYMTDGKEGKQTFGNDATVNWGTTDFVFANSKQYPIKIEFISSGGTITCNIWGTWDGYTAYYGYMDDAVEHYKTIYRRAQTGKKSQTGQLGKTIRSYRIVLYEGVEVDRYCEFTSVYRPLSQVYYTDSLPAGKEYDVEY